MPRFFVSNPRFALDKATALRRSLSSLGHDRRLAECQTAVARIYGYASFAELVATAGTTEPSPLAHTTFVFDLPISEWASIVSEVLRVDEHTAIGALVRTMPTSPFAPAPNSPSELVLRRYGAAILDEPKNPGAGWAAVGKGGAVRFASLGELDPDVVWLTDVPYDVFFLKTDLHRNRQLRHSAYVGVSPSEMLREHGGDADRHANDFVARFAAKTFVSVMKVAEGLLRPEGVEATEPPRLVRRTLRRDLLGLLENREPMTDDVAKRVDRSGGSMTFVSWPDDGERRIQFRTDRIAHAKEVLSASVACGAYEFHGAGDMGADRPGWLSARTGRTLVWTDVGELDDSASIFGFDMGRNAAKRWVLPELITGEEFESVRGYGDVRCGAAVVHESSRPASTLLGERARRFLDGATTWEDGVVAACLWRATMLGDEEGKASYSAAAPWIRVADKSAMIRHALRLREEGFVVRAYGHGWIRATGPDMPPQDVLERLGLTATEL